MRAPAPLCSQPAWTAIAQIAVTPETHFFNQIALQLSSRLDSDLERWVHDLLKKTRLNDLKLDSGRLLQRLRYTEPTPATVFQHARGICSIAWRARGSREVSSAYYASLHDPTVVSAGKDRGLSATDGIRSCRCCACLGPRTVSGCSAYSGGATWPGPLPLLRHIGSDL
jgi:hypothetical protein